MAQTPDQERTGVYILIIAFLIALSAGVGSRILIRRQARQRAAAQAQIDGMFPSEAAQLEVLRLRAEERASRRPRTTRAAEGGREGEELPTYQAAGKDQIIIPLLEPPPPALVRNAGLPPEYVV
ncbi:hypothetical protein CALVIDRAFT_564059 [Calocera viscosa TUFC12733]|uniref:Uncharacterized protein n=1 Tax=Calocera viscosa (strain TUFC12733) TaxID=1330018 RepID=A0A167LYT7_CALVF|nr:hypothetical protein CALVIDRAFT_564059 [Calocera viscosa TUFC12733]